MSVIGVNTEFHNYIFICKMLLNDIYHHYMSDKRKTPVQKNCNEGIIIILSVGKTFSMGMSIDGVKHVTLYIKIDQKNYDLRLT